MKNSHFITSCALLMVLLFTLGAKATPSMISPETGQTMTLVKAIDYCRNLNSLCENRADGVPCGSDAYSGWWLPSAEEMSGFIGVSTGENYLWTRTPYAAELDTYIIMSLLDGSWGWGGYAASVYARCVR